MTTISVIIPTYNRAEMVSRCVASVLAADTAGCAVEIIVVDDCSPDCTARRIERDFGGAVRCLRNGKNSFQAVSRNKGAATAAGEYLFFFSMTTISSTAIFSPSC